MMDGAFLFTESLVSRPSLVAQLQRSLQSRLTLLIASAGYGKTTLLGQWLNALPGSQPKLSMTIEEADNEPAHFLSRFLSGLGAVLPHPDLLPAVDLTQASLAYPLSLLFSKVAQLMQHDWLLLLDDYHLITNPAIHQAVDALLNLPTWPVHLVISSRQQPPLKAVARLRVENRLVELDEHDLRFTPEEVAAFFQTAGTFLSHRQLKLVSEQTEGWAAGLRLLSQASQRHHGADLSHLLDQHANEEHLFNYLASQVLENQGAEIRFFLLRTSLLPYLSADLCNAYLESTDSAEIIRKLEQNHLFINAYSEGNSQCLRYHSLFADFLQHCLEQEEGQSGVKSWQRRVAACLLQSQAYLTPGQRQQAYLAAIDAYLLAGNLNEAADAIETVVDLLDWGQLTLMGKWFERLPQEVIQTRPRLGMALGLLRERQCRWNEALAAFSQAEPLFQVENDIENLTHALNRQAWVCLRRGEYTQAQTLAQRALALYSENTGHPSSPGISRQKAESHLLLGNIYFETGDFEHAIQMDQEALYLFQKCLSKVDEARALSHLAYIYGNQGRLAEYIDSERRALSIFDELGSLRACSSLVGLSDVYRQLGEYELSRQMADRALQLSDAYQDPLQRGYALFLLGHWYREKGHFTQAHEYYAEARRIGEELHEPCLLGEPRRGLALLALAENNLPEARRQAQAAVEQMQTIGYRELESQALITWGVVLERCGDIDQAEATYSKAQTMIQELGDAFALATLYLYLADLFRHESRQPEAIESLSQALLLSRQYGYDTFFTLRERDRTLPLLILALENQDQPSLQTLSQSALSEVIRLLGLIGSPAVEPLLGLLTSLSPDAPILETILKLLGEIGDERAIPVLDSLQHHRTLKSSVQRALQSIQKASIQVLRISTLGAFEVERGAVPIPTAAWQQRRKTRLLLLYLLIHRNRHIPRDELLEMLWPDLEPDSAGLALNTTFSDVRKLLEPYLAKGMPSHYLAHDNECYWFVPESPVWYDVQAFEEAIHQGEAGAHSALELYRGDFFPEEPYIDWVVRERERLLNQYLNLLMGLLEKQLRQGAWHEGVELAQRILLHERWLEEVWRALMTCYNLLGRRSEALQAYLTCERYLREDLGVEPGVETLALYEQLKA